MPITTVEHSEPDSRGTASGSRPAPPRSRLPAVLDWLLCASALRQARAHLAGQQLENAELLRQSRLALEVGDRVLDPVVLPRHGSGAAQAAELFRQALHWALAASTPPNQSTSEQNDTLLAQALADAEQLSSAQRLLSLDEPFVFFAGLGPAEQRKTALFLRQCAVRVLQIQEAPRQAVLRLQALRWVRLSIVPLLALCIGLTVVALLPEKLDLARDKPWTTSSVYVKCEPEKGLCANVRTLIKFHTLADASPWFEIDLGAPTRFSSLTVRNRSDGNGGESERAVPLIVEVSNDHQTYTEVAQRKTNFSVWKPDVGQQEARYVRLRVPRQTYLHLEDIKVHP
jgi:F5/8 type C domain-containing protein